MWNTGSDPPSDRGSWFSFLCPERAARQEHLLNAILCIQRNAVKRNLRKGGETGEAPESGCSDQVVIHLVETQLTLETGEGAVAVDGGELDTRHRRIVGESLQIEIETETGVV